MLCYDLTYYTMQCNAMICYTIRYYNIPCNAMQCNAMLYYTITILYYTIIYDNIQGNPVAAETDIDMLSRVMEENLAASLSSQRMIEAGTFVVVPFFPMLCFGTRRNYL